MQIIAVKRSSDWNPPLFPQLCFVLSSYIYQLVCDMVTGTKIFFLALLLQRLGYCEGVLMILMSRAQKAKAAFQQNKANKNQELCWRREKCCFCWRGSVRYRRRHTGASSLDDFWPWRILWVLILFHVAVTDVHHHTGSGLCSCVQLVFLSCISREKQSCQRMAIWVATQPVALLDCRMLHIWVGSWVCAAPKHRWAPAQLDSVSSHNTSWGSCPGRQFDHRSVRHHKIHTSSCLWWVFYQYWWPTALK